MKNLMLFFIIFLLSFSAWAMTPLTESDLSNFSYPFNFTINPNVVIVGINDEDIATLINLINSYNISEFLQNSINLTINSGIPLNKNSSEPIETPLITQFMYDLSLWLKNISSLNDRKFHTLIFDPITGKDNTTIISVEDANATNCSSNIPVDTNYSIPYSDRLMSSSNTLLAYIMRFDNIDMRNCFIDQPSTM
jgi:hypothetical protein